MYRGFFPGGVLPHISYRSISGRKIGFLPRGGRGFNSDFKWQGWSNGAKNHYPKKSLDQKLAPKKSHAESLNLNRRARRPGFSVGTITILQIVLNSQNNPYLNQATKKKILSKFYYPKRSWNRKFQTPRNPVIIPVTWNPEYPPPPWGFLGRFGLKTSIDFAYRVWFSREPR